MSISIIVEELLALGLARRAAPNVEDYQNGQIILAEAFTESLTLKASEYLLCYLKEAETEVIQEQIQEIATRAEAKITAAITAADNAATEAGTTPAV